jgi:protein-arginine kinase activator protein McsA
MTDEQIEKLAQRIASILYNKAHADLTFEIPDEDEEQVLLAEMSKLMTLLDAYLKKEEYDKCAIIQEKIKIIEKKLNKL